MKPKSTFSFPISLSNFEIQLLVRGTAAAIASLESGILLRASTPPVSFKKVGNTNEFITAVVSAGSGKTQYATITMGTTPALLATIGKTTPTEIRLLKKNKAKLLMMAFLAWKKTRQKQLSHSQLQTFWSLITKSSWLNCFLLLFTWYIL
jgi:hypothetical protein